MHFFVKNKNAFSSPICFTLIHKSLSIFDKNRSYFIRYSYSRCRLLSWTPNLDIYIYRTFLSSPCPCHRAHKQHKTTVTLLTYGRRVNARLLHIAAIKSLICRITRLVTVIPDDEWTNARNSETRIAVEEDDECPSRGLFLHLSFFTPTFGSCSTGRLSSRIRQHAYCKSRTGSRSASWSAKRRFIYILADGAARYAAEWYVGRHHVFQSSLARVCVLARCCRSQSAPCRRMQRSIFHSLPHY